jgi:hypothetical protein
MVKSPLPLLQRTVAYSRQAQYIQHIDKERMVSPFFRTVNIKDRPLVHRTIQTLVATVLLNAKFPNVLVVQVLHATFAKKCDFFPE